MDELEQFKSDRSEALQSLDRQKILDYMIKYDSPAVFKLATADDDLFWRSVHKAITGCSDLPIEFRRKSKDWLAQRGSASLDEGDL